MVKAPVDFCPRCGEPSLRRLEEGARFAPPDAHACGSCFWLGSVKTLREARA